jgi:EpsI family protein
MIKRRDLILATLGLGAVGAAEALRPRRRVKLLKPGASINDTIPVDFDTWQAQRSELVNPEQAGRLARSLYSETIMRTYYDGKSGSEVMMLAAYGDTQSDLLQLHRPESCYPAVGFAIRSSVPVMMPLPGGGELPGREVVATLQDRVENIFYWARMGDALPQTGGEQRDARLENALHGFVADGILMRCSVLGDSAPAFAVLRDFVPRMLHAVPPAGRPALIGTTLASRVA